MYIYVLDRIREGVTARSGGGGLSRPWVSRPPLAAGRICTCSLEGTYKSTRRREFKPPWRKAGLLKSSRWSSGFRPVSCQWSPLSVPAHPTRWSTILSSEVNLHHPIHLSALRDATLVTYPVDFTENNTGRICTCPPSAECCCLACKQLAFAVSSHESTCLCGQFTRIGQSPGDYGSFIKSQLVSAWLILRPHVVKLRSRYPHNYGVTFARVLPD